MFQVYIERPKGVNDVFFFLLCFFQSIWSVCIYISYSSRVVVVDEEVNNNCNVSMWGLQTDKINQ